MIRAALAIVAALALAACAASTPAPVDLAAASSWTLGPQFGDGTNASAGVPLHPAAEDGGWGFGIPQSTFPPTAHVHYVTAPYGSLAGKARLRLRFRIAAPAGVRILARTAEGAPSMLTLYFQRRGDDWSGQGKFETYRWYATFATVTPLAAGEYEVVAPLDGAWTAIQSSTLATAPQAFADAIADADEVGFVLGGGDGYGHGVYADGGTAHLTVTSFEVE